MEELQKLYNVLIRDGYTTKSPEEFMKAWEDDVYQTKVHSIMTRDKKTDKDAETFKEVYKVPVVNTKNPVVTKKNPLESQGDVVYGENFWNTYQGGNFKQNDWRLNDSGILEKNTGITGTQADSAEPYWKWMPKQEEVTVGSGIDNIYNQLKYQKANPNWQPEYKKIETTANDITTEAWGKSYDQGKTWESVSYTKEQQLEVQIKKENKASYYAAIAKATTGDDGYRFAEDETTSIKFLTKDFGKYGFKFEYGTVGGELGNSLAKELWEDDWIKVTDPDGNTKKFEVDLSKDGGQNSDAVKELKRMVAWMLTRNIRSNDVKDVNAHQLLGIMNKEPNAKEVDKKLAENYFNLDNLDRKQEYRGSGSIKDGTRNLAYVNSLEKDIAGYFGEKKYKQYLEYQKTGVWNPEVEDANGVMPGEDGYIKTVWDSKNEQKKKVIVNKEKNRNLQNFSEGLSQKEIDAAELIRKKEAYKVFDIGDEADLAEYKAAVIKDEANQKQITRDSKGFELFDTSTWDEYAPLDMTPSYKAYKRSQNESEASKVLTKYFNRKYTQLKEDSDLYIKQATEYTELKSKWEPQIKVYTNKILKMQKMGNPTEADVQNYKNLQDLLRGALNDWGNEIKGAGIDFNVLLNGADNLQRRQDRLNDGSENLENLDMVAKSLIADYSLGSRLMISGEQTYVHAAIALKGIMSGFAGASEYLVGTVEMASTHMGPQKVIESMFGKGDITDLRATPGTGPGGTQIWHDHLNYSLDYLESLNAYKETSLSLNIDWEDATWDNLGHYSSQLLGNNAFTIASALTYGGAIKAGVNVAMASNALSTAFFVVEGSSKYQQDYTNQKYAAENIEGLNIALSNTSSPDERNSILKQIEDQEIYKNKTEFDKAFSAIVYGGIATYAERLGTMRYVRNMARLKPKGLRMSFEGTYQGVKQTVFNTGIEYVEEFGTQVFHNLWDYAYMGENKSLMAGIDANFNANVIFSTLAIQAPSTSANVYNTIRSEVATQIEIGANKTRAEEMIVITEQLQAHEEFGDILTPAEKTLLEGNLSQLRNEAALADSYTFARVANMTGAEIHAMFEANQKLRDNKAKLQNLGAQSAGDKVNPYIEKQKEKILNEQKQLLDQKEGLNAKATERQKEVTAEILKDEVQNSESQFWIGRAFGAKNIAKGLGKVKVFDGKVIKNSETGKNEVDLTEVETYLTKKVKAGKITEQQKAGYLKGFKEGANASFVGNEMIYVEGNVIRNINNSKTNLERSIHAYASLHELQHLNDMTQGLVKDGDVVASQKRAVEEMGLEILTQIEQGRIKEQDGKAILDRISAYQKSNGGNVNLAELLTLAGELKDAGMLNENSTNPLLALKLMINKFSVKHFGDGEMFVRLKDGKGVLQYIDYFQNKVRTGRLMLGPEEKTKKPQFSKGTLSQEAIKQIKERITEIGLTYNFKGGKKLWDEGGSKAAIDEITRDGLLDDLIASKYKVRPVPADFVKTVLAQLVTDIKDFNPEINDNFGGYLGPRVNWRAGDVYKEVYEKKGPTTVPTEAKTKEGEVKIQVAAEKDAAMKEFETKDVGITAQIKEKKAEEKAKEEGKTEKQRESEFRNEFGIETNDNIYNKVLETTRIVLKRAYEIGTRVRNIQRKLVAEANKYKSPDGQTLYDIVLFKLGTKKAYFENLAKFRIPIMNLMFTADLVQMEREVADDKKVFTKFVKKLTTLKEVEDAVDQMRLPPSAIEAYEKDKSVNEYEKLMPTEEQFIGFFNQPLNIPNPKDPKTTKQSNVRGERKQALARRIVGGMVLDATIQVAQEPAIIKFRESMAEMEGETLAEKDLENLAAAIDREVDVMFSRATQKLSDLQKDRKTLPAILKKEYQIEKRILKEPIEGDLIALEKLSDLEKAIESGVDPLTAYDIFMKDMPLNAKHSLVDFSNINNFTQYIRNILVPEIRDLGFKASKVYFKNQFDKAGTTKQKVDLVNRYLKNVGISARGGKGLVTTFTNQQLLEGPISEIFGAKFVNEHFNLEDIKEGKKEGKTIKYRYNGKTFETVPLYKDIDAIKDSRGKSDIVKEVNDEAKEARAFIQEIIDSDLSISEKLAIIDLLSLNGRGPIRKMYTFGQTVTNKVGKDVELVLEHEITVKNMTKYLRQRVKGILTQEQLDEIIDQAKVHVWNSEIDNILREQGLSQDGGRLRYQNSEVQKYLINQKEKGLIDNLPIEIKKVNNLNKAILFSRSTNNPTKGITVLDFDDTLATTKSSVLFTRPDGTKGKLNAQQYASTYESLADQGYKFDFTEFNKVIKGKKAPLFEKALKLQDKFGAKDMFVLTARPIEATPGIHAFLKANGLNIPMKNITGLGNSTAKAKADWMAAKVGDGYNDFYFADDALQNVKAVKNILDQLDVKSKVQQARIMFSKGIDLEFNKMLKRTTGVPTQSKFSDVQAKLRGRKNKYFEIIPASAQDFMGLMYNFLGKGKQGDKDIAFFKKALINPFARAINELNTSKQKAEIEYKKIIKDLPDTKKILNDKIDDNFTVDQAIRVYLWNKAGYEIPGLSKRDLKMLDEFVKSDAELMEFAYEVSQISNKEGGYSKPGNFWVTENIGSDLFSDGALGEARATFLTQWQENSDQIFSKDNLNKIEAIYGYKFREALEDVLYRMKTGRNRPTGASRLQNEYMNWVNGSVGAIMFFNIRSAVLQTISATNYLNWTDNNPALAAAAFANQKQFWSDFTMLFNSDYLKQRRSKNQRSVSESELSEAVTGVGAYEQTKAAIRYLLKIGFKPTQIADSFAIASGGATFYRNRVKTYTKEGMSQVEAEAKAFLDFQESTEVSQQSARPDMISQQQASPLGRLILSFQNTPMQYARIMNKAARDLANNRGDTKTHISKIAYYGIVQSIIFASLQSALFAVIGMDDDEELIKDKNGVMPGKDGYIKTVRDVKGEFLDKKKDRILNTMVDSWLAGIGYGGKAVSAVKNTVLEYLEQKDKGFTGDHAYTILAMLGFSPPIGSKVQKVYSSIQTEKFNEGVVKKRGFSLDNPIWMGIGSTVEALTNIPVGRLAKKMLNLDNAMDSSNEWWQRVALVLGWSTWDLGIKDKDIEQAKLEVKQDKEVVATQKKEDEKWEKIKKKYPKKSDEQIKVILKTKELFNLSKEEQVNLLKSLDIDPRKFKTEKERAKKIAELYKENSEVIDGVVTLSNSKTKEQKAEELKEYREKNKKKKVKVNIDPRKKYKRKGDPRKR